jgi:hypothetical protein
MLSIVMLNTAIEPNVLSVLMLNEAVYLVSKMEQHI